MSGKEKWIIALIIVVVCAAINYTDYNTRKEVQAAYDTCMSQMSEKTPAAVAACTDKAKAIR